MQGCGGTEAGVAACKQELFDSALAGDLCVINRDDPWTSRMPLPTGVIPITFGRGTDCDIQLAKVDRAGLGRMSVRLRDNWRGT